MVFTGKGYKKSLKLAILSNGFINSFSNYFPKGSKFIVIYIEDTMIGSWSPYYLKPAPLSVPPTSKSTDTVTFENLLRNFPLLSTVVSERFYRLFHHNNKKFPLIHSNTRKNLSLIKNEFDILLDDAYSIILNSVKPGNAYGEQTHNLIAHILNLYPGLDLNKLVHEYVELNLYDKLWGQLLIQFNSNNDDSAAVKVLTTEKYNELAYLSLNQLDIPIQTPWNSNILHEKVVSSIEELKKLQDSSIVNLPQKTDILIKSINRLTDTKGTDLVIDADTLIGLLIMVVVHSKINNLEAHLYYIKSFNSSDLSGDGQFNYILSNFDAVIYHLSETVEDSDLVKQSYANFDLVSAIQNNDVQRLTEMFDKIDGGNSEKDLTNNHYLKSRSVYGESALMHAVKARNVDVFRLLLTYNPNWFSIEDILFDKNVSSNLTLLMTAISEGCEDISNDLIEIIMTNCSEEEMYLYFNSTDTFGRSIGHYLFHNINLIDVIGQFIDWEIKDTNSYTPLLTLCRCYDHQDYELLLEKVFKCVYKKYGRGTIDFDKHIDKTGNSLLHVISKGLSKTEILSDRKNLVCVDQLNNRSMTPLVLAVKYNRIEIIQDLLNDQRLEFLFEDPKNYYNVLDYTSNLNTKIEVSDLQKAIESQVFEYYLTNYYPRTPNMKLIATNAKYDPNKRDWIVYLKSNTSTTNQIYLEKLKQIIYITKLDKPLSIFPTEETFWLNYKLGGISIPIFHKYQINRLIENLNILLISVSFQNNGETDKLFQKLLNSSSSVNEKLTLEYIKHISKLHEIQRDKVGEIELSLVNIKEIDTFLEYSFNDLNNCYKKFDRLNKLVSVGDIKNTDVRSNYFEALQRYNKGKFRGNFKELEFLSVHSGLNSLHDITMKVEVSLIELMGNLNKVLTKTKVWKEIYIEIKDLNAEIKKYEDQVADSVVKELPRRNTFSTVPLPEEITFEGNDGYFNFITENKRSKYNRLIALKGEKVDKIMKLNVEIKIDHEIIASEISNFLQFRSNLLQFGVKKFVFQSIKENERLKYQFSKLKTKVP